MNYPYDHSAKQAIINEVCAQLARGIPLTRICEPVNMPDRVTIYAWAKDDPAIAQQIARAREAGFDHLAEGCLDIADEAVGSTQAGGTDSGAVQNKKVRIWARLELLKRWDPKRYGDSQRVDHTSSDGTMSPHRIELVAPDADRKD